MKIEILKNANFQGREFVTGQKVDIDQKTAKALIAGNVARAESKSGTAKKSDHDSE